MLYEVITLCIVLPVSFVDCLAIQQPIYYNIVNNRLIFLTCVHYIILLFVISVNNKIHVHTIILEESMELGIIIALNLKNLRTERNSYNFV